MRDFQSLKFLALFKSVCKRLGIDYEAMDKILRIKLTMDERRVPTIFNDARKKKDGNQFLKSLWIYGLYGLMLIPFMVLDGNYIFQMSIAFGIIMFFLATSMISDFSSVLLDVRDKNILQTKPISGRTISAAKIIHIMIYMAFITGSFVTIPLIVGLFKHGIAFTLIFLVELLLTILLVVVFTSLLYLFILRFFDGEKLKDIINYVQIILTVGVVIGYQILIRSFQFVDLDFTYLFSWWHFFIPPIWYGALFELLLAHHVSDYMLVFAILALCVPLLAMYSYARLMPSFERNLEKLMNDTKKRKRKSNWWDEAWAKMVCWNAEERVFFRFAVLMMKKEREFKLKVYPALGMSLVFPFVFIFNELRERPLSDIATGNMFLFMYFCNLMIPNIVHMLKFSGSYKGSWLFKAAPIQQPSAAYSGALKAFLVKLYVPIFLVLGFVFTWIFTVRILPDLFVIFLVGIVQMLITYTILKAGEYPFSESFEFAQDAGTAKMLLLGLLVGIFVVGHLIASIFDYGIYVYIVVLCVAILLGWRRMFPRNHGLKAK
ncbi:hypothetical protein [Sporosarcina beigongshangi]|uniref:hypothetical protein n=1 Tax=Sporosarcina beigongshangi TaxID=2782538 RepID=UPI001939BB4A|nr:hypothetical protein [Sporosarcina beigongshangi]